jgi:ABC-type antimicrobial peptide transport system permease subunit
MMREILLLASRNIRRRKTRSLLTILGIGIGIASVVLFVSIGEGMKVVVIASFGDIGNDLIVMPKFDPNSGKPGKLTLDDLKEIERIEGVLGAAPRLSRYATIKYKGYTDASMVVGVDPSRERKIGVKIWMGRFLRDSDKHAVVLGFKRRNITASPGVNEKKTYQERKHSTSKGKDYLGPQRDGKIIQLDVRRPITLSFDSGGGSNEKRFKVVGILSEGGLAGDVFSQPDKAVIMSIDTLRKISGAKEEFTQIMVRVEDPGMAEDVSRRIQERTDTNVMSLKRILESVGSFFKIVEVVFIFIGSIALLVAGFGIMNTMLMSVLERTREIGVLKSIGATRAHVIRIFLLESGLIGFIGGVSGLLVGIAGSKIINLITGLILKNYFRLPAENLSALSPLTVIPLWLVFFSIGFAVFISMIFGLYPAVRASNLSPVEALRYL